MSMLCCASALGDPAAVVAVERGAPCPTGEMVGDALNVQLDVVGRRAATVGQEGEFLLRVVEAPGETDVLHVELRTHAGHALMARDLGTHGASCSARARSVAVMVQRYLEALSEPPAGVRGAAPLQAQPEPFARFEPRAGLSLDAGRGEDLQAGVALGAAVRPYRWLALHLCGGLHVPRHEPAGTGDVSLSRQSLTLAATAAFRLGPARIEAGPGGRVDFVAVETQGLGSDNRTVRLNPAVVGVAGVSVPVRATLLAYLTVEVYDHTRSQVFTIQPIGEVARTSDWGLALALGLGYGVFTR
jgi:hypothetical protein